jgi:hypothetical protein
VLFSDGWSSFRRKVTLFFIEMRIHIVEIVFFRWDFLTVLFNFPDLIIKYLWVVILTFLALDFGFSRRLFLRGFAINVAFCVVSFCVFWSYARRVDVTRDSLSSLKLYLFLNTSFWRRVYSWFLFSSRIRRWIRVPEIKLHNQISKIDILRVRLIQVLKVPSSICNMTE